MESGLQAARGLVVIPVLMLILSAAAVFVSGTVLLIRAFSQMMRHALPVGRSGLFLVPETFLVGTALIIAGTAFYQLFVSETWMAELRRHLPQWLVIRALADFTARLIPLLALIAVGGFVSAAGGSRSGPGILLLGGAVALVIVALSAFLRSGSDR